MVLWIRRTPAGVAGRDGITSPFCRICIFLKFRDPRRPLQIRAQKQGRKQASSLPCVFSGKICNICNKLLPKGPHVEAKICKKVPSESIPKNTRKKSAEKYVKREAWHPCKQVFRLREVAISHLCSICKKSLQNFTKSLQT